MRFIPDQYNLLATSEPEDKMKSGLLLDVIVAEGAAILQLLASKDQPLLVWGDALLILDLGLNILDGVAGLNLKGDGLAGEGLDEDLHGDTARDKEEHTLIMQPRSIHKEEFVYDPQYRQLKRRHIFFGKLCG